MTLGLLPDVRTRPIFQPLAINDWFILLAPWIILCISIKLLMTRPNEPTPRYFLLPLGAMTFFMLATARDYSGGIPQSNAYNYGVGLFSFAGAMKLTEVTFLRRSPKRMVTCVSTSGLQSKTSNGHGKSINGNVKTTHIEMKEEIPTGQWKEVLAYLGDPRGIQYHIGTPIPQTPKLITDSPTKPYYLFTRLWRTAYFILLFDLLQTIGQSVPGTTMGTPQGGSIYVPTLSPIYRYLVSSMVVWNMGAGIYAGIQAGFELYCLLSVGLLGNEPSDHPPVFYKPWTATSVRELWSKRWHSVFKSYFNAIGWTVGYALLGTFGGVLGVFTLSGLLHDVTIWGMGRGTDPFRIVGFFYLQGIAVILEDIWRRITGKKVCGRWGRLWTWTFMTITSHLVVEAWMQKGLGGGAYFMADEHRPFLLLRNYLRQIL